MDKCPERGQGRGEGSSGLRFQVGALTIWSLKVFLSILTVRKRCSTEP